MLTTLGKRIHAAFKREPIAFCLTAFLLLAGAGTGMTANQILTAVPSASGAVNLASTTGSEGTGTALMRADATLGVQGILPVAKGGTGNANGAVNLQAATPGTPQTGHLNISGTAISANHQATVYYNTDATGYGTAWDSVNKILSGFNPGGPPGGSPLWQWNTGTTAPGFSNDNGNVYQWSVNNTPGLGINRNGRVFVGAGPVLGGIAGLGNSGVFVEVPGNGADPSLVVDTAGVAASPTTKKLFIVRNNGTEKFSVQADGVINTTAGGMMSKVGSASVTLAALSVGGSACAYDTTTGTVTSAVTTDQCTAVYVTGLGTTALSMSCEVTASNTVSWRFCNHTTSAVGIPVAQSYIAYVMR